MGDALYVHGGATSAQEARLAMAGQLALQGPTAIDVRTGVMGGPGSTALVTGTAATAPMTVAIAPHHWVTTRGAANGPYLGALEAAMTVTIAAAPAAGAGTRIDVVYVRQKDSTAGVPTPDAATAPEYGVITGTAGGAKPSLSSAPGAEELATVSVSPGATATNGANIVITNTARQTVPRGARIPVRNQAEHEALTAFRGLEVYRLDTGKVELCTAAGPPAVWQTLFDPAALGGDASYIMPSNAAALPIAANGSIKVPFATSVSTHPDITPNAAFDTFTLNRAGLWLIDTSVRYAANGTGSRNQVSIQDGPPTTVYRAATEIVGASGAIDVPLAVTKRFPAGQTISIGAFSSVASNIDIGTRNSLSLTFIRP